MASKMVAIATSISSRVVLNDGVSMPLFGLGVYMSSTGKGGGAETSVQYAISKGYRLIDTAEFYGNEADVGRGIKSSGLKREDIFVVTKLWDNGYSRCKKVFTQSLRKLDIGHVDLYLIHSPFSGKIVETYKAMLELKDQGLIRSVGVSNFGVQHLEGLKNAGLPKPSVNQIELHPWQQKVEIVQYCRQNDIAVMGYSPLAKGTRFGDQMVQDIAKRIQKTEAQVMIRWSVQNGYITIPKSSNNHRIDENMNVFDWSLSEEDMETLNSFPDHSCTWNPTSLPWSG